MEALNGEQKEFYNEITRSIKANQGKTFFLDALGGTGKTYVAETTWQVS